MKATFEHSVNVLKTAYLNNTLENNDCHSCAVGNLVANSMGLQVQSNGIFTLWGKPGESIDELSASRDRKRPAWYPLGGAGCTPERKIRHNQQIRGTGYSRNELKKIEKAFEDAEADKDLISKYTGVQDRTGMLSEHIIYAGLLAVVDVLAKIHGVDPATTKQATCELQQAYQTRATALVNS